MGWDISPRYHTPPTAPINYYHSPNHTAHSSCHHSYYDAFSLLCGTSLPSSYIPLSATSFRSPTFASLPLTGPHPSTPTPHPTTFHTYSCTAVPWTQTAELFSTYLNLLNNNVPAARATDEGRAAHHISSPRCRTIAGGFDADAWFRWFWFAFHRPRGDAQRILPGRDSVAPRAAQYGCWTLCEAGMDRSGILPDTMAPQRILDS